MRDTTDEAARVVREIVRRRTPDQRLADLIESSEMMRAAALDRLAVRHPGASRADLLRRLLGDDAVLGVRHGPRPGR